MSAASGIENMASGSQETLPEVGNTTAGIPAASDLKIMETQTQGPLPEVGDIATNTLPAASKLELMETQPQHDAEENALAISDVTIQRNKRRCASSGTARCKSLIFIELSHRTMT